MARELWLGARLENCRGATARSVVSENGEKGKRGTGKKSQKEKEGKGRKSQGQPPLRRVVWCGGAEAERGDLAALADWQAEVFSCGKILSACAIPWCHDQHQD